MQLFAKILNGLNGFLQSRYKLLRRDPRVCGRACPQHTTLNTVTEAADPQLDAEYRAFIRAMHKETIDTILAVETWWTPDCFRIVTLGGYSAEGADSKDVADRIEQEWRRTIYPRLLTLVHGHPDPDVRYAADILATRLWSIIVILVHARRPETGDRDENMVAIHLVHDGFMRLHRAAYHAPFRINRPQPQYDGLAIGNAEPMPHKLLETIRALQDAGVLENDSGIGIRAIPDAVRRLSDILFMPEAERAALFKGSAVPDPATEPRESQSETEKLKFGFRP